MQKLLSLIQSFLSSDPMQNKTEDSNHAKIVGVSHGNALNVSKGNILASFAKCAAVAHNKLSEKKGH